MRVFFFFPLFIFISCQPASGQDKTSPIADQVPLVRAVITEFLTAGDLRDVTRLDAVLNPQYRVSVNQFMGSPGVTVIDRASYLGMIKAGKLGGTPREVRFKSVEVVGNLAFVRAELESEELHFDNLLVLAQDGLGDWTLLSDTPYVTPK